MNIDNAILVLDGTVAVFFSFNNINERDEG